eukprot:2520125-Rhodomonas_salina.1
MSAIESGLRRSKLVLLGGVLSRVRLTSTRTIQGFIRRSMNWSYQMANPNEDYLLAARGCSADATAVEEVARGRGVGAGGAEHFHARAVGVV